MSEIESIQKISVVDEVYEQLKMMIAEGKWVPGVQMPSEAELTRQFNVSRNTIRSAISKLKGIGVVVTKQGQGTFVCKSAVESIVNSIIPLGLLSDNEVIEIAQFRKSIELGSVYYAALNRTDAELLKIKEALDRMKSCLNDYQQHAEADYEFHIRIASASKNRYYFRVYVSLREIIYKHFERMSKDLGTEISIKEHEKIYEAIRDRDGELAQFITSANIEKSLDMMENWTK